jgi:hypothetical protein
MFTINCRFHPGDEEHGLNFLVNHFGAVSPESDLNFFSIKLDKKKVQELLCDAMENTNAHIVIEFDDFTMEIK